MDSVFTDHSETRKTYPVYSGVIKYFPDALAMISHRSWEGQQQHNPDKPLFWDRSKSGDELDAMMRHIIDGDWDAVAWRALANLQKQWESGWRPNHEIEGSQYEPYDPTEEHCAAMRSLVATPEFVTYKGQSVHFTTGKRYEVLGCDIDGYTVMTDTGVISVIFNWECEEVE